MFNMNMGNWLIISFLFMTTLNCLVTYFCSSSSLKYLSKTKSYTKAINRIHLFDKYLLTSLTLLTSILYVFLSYGYFKYLLDISDYIICLSVFSGFILSLITTFFSRLCYCYACNVLLKTTLNALQCFRENFFYLLRMFYPVFLVSFVIPTIYIFPISMLYRNIAVVGFIVGYLTVWLLSTPYKTMLVLNARKMRNKDLLSKITKLFKDNNIKKYSVYYWDSTKSNEANAIISGIFKRYLFISTTLIEKMEDRELEAVILHEIGHIKNHHIKKSLFLKSLLLIAVSLIVCYLVMFEEINMLFVLLLVALFVYVARINLYNSKKEEEQADLFVNSKGYGKELISALKKIGMEGSSENKIDELLSTHPSTKKRISQINNKH